MPSLDPCYAGAHFSIIDSNDFPDANGKKADRTQFSNMTSSPGSTSGCFHGQQGSVVCQEGSSVTSNVMNTIAGISATQEPVEKVYAELNITVPEFVRYLSFDYTFTNTGDGDYVYLFAGGNSIWKMSGDAVDQGEKVSSGLIPLRLDTGADKLVVALYSVGVQNAEFEIENFKFTTVFDSDGDGCADDEDAYPDCNASPRIGISSSSC